MAMIQSYQFKISNNIAMCEDVQRLLDIAEEAAQPLLDSLWSEQWVDRLGQSAGKTYKFIPEGSIVVVRAGMVLYIPDRVQRCISEWVGRTLRSQYERKECFEDVRGVLEIIGVRGNLNTLIRKVNWTLKALYNKYYNWSLLRQTLRMIRRWVLKYGFDIANIHYTDIVKPNLAQVTFPYAPDDGQTNGEAIQYEMLAASAPKTAPQADASPSPPKIAPQADTSPSPPKIVQQNTGVIEYEVKNSTIHIRIKIPTTPFPLSMKDWEWVEETIHIPKKVQYRINKASSYKPQLPDLRIIRLKGGLLIPVLQFAWQYAQQELNVAYYDKQRVLAVDTGLINLATSVVCQAGSQITAPIFYRNPMFAPRAIKHIYQLIANIQRKLSHFSGSQPGQNRRRTELSRLHAKLTRSRLQLTYLIVKELLRQAATYGCGTLVLEDLSAYTPPAGKHGLSRDLNNWAHGLLLQHLKRKATLIGIKVETVPPYGTSSYCPRCGKKGLKVRSPTVYIENKRGRHFWCPHCQYRADRDYIGALNIYRVFRLPKKQRYFIKQAKPVVYKKAEASLRVTVLAETTVTGEH